MGEYRVVKTTSDHFGEFNHGSEVKRLEQELWKGSDTSELSKQYPPSEIFGADPLSHSEIEDGLIRFDYDFQELQEGEWVTISDPRIRHQAGLTELEREIDAENRRRYPGDFVDEEPDYDDHYYDQYEPEDYDESWHEGQDQE